MLTEAEELELLELEEQEAIENGVIKPQPTQNSIPKGIRGQYGQLQQALSQPIRQVDPRYPDLAKKSDPLAALTVLGNAVPVAIDRMAGYKESKIGDPKEFTSFAKPISEPLGKMGRAVGETYGRGMAYQTPIGMQSNPEESAKYMGNIGQKTGEMVGEFVASAASDPTLLASGVLGVAAKGYGAARPAIREGIAAIRELTAKPFTNLSDAITKSDVRFLSKDLKKGAKIETLKKYGIHGATEDAEEVLSDKIAELTNKARNMLKSAGKKNPIIDLNRSIDNALEETFAKGTLGREAKSEQAINSLKESIRSLIDKNGRVGHVNIADALQIKSAWGDEAAFAAVGQKMGIDPNATVTKEVYTKAFTVLRDHIEKAVQEAFKNPTARRELNELNQDIHSLIAVKNAVKYRNGVKARQNVLPSRNVWAGGLGGVLGGVKGAAVGMVADAALKSPATARLLNWMGKRIQGKGVAEREQLFDVLRKKGIPENEIADLRAYYRRSGRNEDFDQVQTFESLPERDWGETGKQWKNEKAPEFERAKELLKRRGKPTNDDAVLELIKSGEPIPETFPPKKRKEIKPETKLNDKGELLDENGNVLFHTEIPFPKEGYLGNKDYEQSYRNARELDRKAGLDHNPDEDLYEDEVFRTEGGMTITTSPTPHSKSAYFDRPSSEQIKPNKINYLGREDGANLLNQKSIELSRVPEGKSDNPKDIAYQKSKSTIKGTTVKTDKGARIEFGKEADLETALHEIDHAADYMDKLPDSDRKAFVKAMGLKEWDDEARERMAYGVAYLAREGELPKEFPKALQSRLKIIAEKAYGQGEELKKAFETQMKAGDDYLDLAMKGQSAMWEGMPEKAKDAIKSALKRGVAEKRLRTLSSAAKKATSPAVFARIVSQINREYNE